MKKKVALFFGGKSVEHDISIITAMQIYALIKETYDVVPVYIDKNGLWYSGKLTSLDDFKDNNLINRKDVFRVNLDVHSKCLFKQKNTSCQKKYTAFDIALNVCHGGSGENGNLSGLFETYGICYTGSNSVSSGICMDKSLTKTLLKSLKIDTVKGYSFTENEWAENSIKVLEKIKKTLGDKVIVKPSRLGSSIGIKKASTKIDLIDAVENAFKFDNKVLVEECVEDFKEINIALLGLKNEIILSNIEEVYKKDDFLSFEDKYIVSGSLKGMESKTATLEKEILDKIKEVSKNVYEKFDLKGIVRMDFIVKDEKVYLNEINTIPGSLAFYLFEANDIVFKMLEDAENQSEQRKDKIFSFNSNVLNVTDLTKCVK